ncbi:MAG TPA: hypothetical protein VJ738_03260 [Steroidobacteraceae bacterium]|nr:hypothetical protein [Steroidobacteraceae bacterium]
MVSICKAVLAFLGALLIAVAGAVLVIGLPIWIAAFTYGRQRIMDVPGHDGAFTLVTMIFTVPVALVLSLGLLGYLTVVFYRLLSASKVR